MHQKAAWPLPNTAPADPLAPLREQKAELFDPNVELFDPKVEHFDPNVELFDSKAGFFDPNVEVFDPKAGLFDPKAQLFDPKVGHFDSKVGHFDPKVGHFDSKAQLLDSNVGHFDRKPPCSMLQAGVPISQAALAGLEAAARRSAPGGRLRIGTYGTPPLVKGVARQPIRQIKKGAVGTLYLLMVSFVMRLLRRHTALPTKARQPHRGWQS